MKLLSTLFLGSLMLLKSVASSQEYFPSGARFQSIADASSALDGIWSVYANQAGLAKLNNIELAASYQNRYLLRELSTNSLIFALPVQSSVFAMSFSQFGKNTFRHEMFGLIFARRVLP